MSLQAGVAVRDISPRKPLFLVGYPHVPRTSTGVHDPLLASALFLSDGKTSLLLISVDVLFITSESTKLCREAIVQACGVPTANILISATHTHSAPLTASMLAWKNDPVVPPPDAEYLEQFHAAIFEAAVSACQSARPAGLAVTSGHISGVGSNRLAPDGPFDPEASLLAVRSQGKLIALSLIYGMHPTVLHEDSTLVSSDFPHYTREQIRAAFPGVTTVYHNAPCGNLSPRYYVRSQTFAEAERLGRKLGDQVVAMLRQLRDEHFHSDISLAASQSYAELLPNQFPSIAGAEDALRRAREDFELLKRAGAPHGPMRTAECVVFGCQERLTLAQAQATGETARWQERYRKAEVQVFRLGELFVVGFPGELFVEYALQLKRAVPGRTAMVGLANGELQGYIVTPEARNQSSYEAAFALFAAESGQHLVNAALRQLKELAS
jgi:neutral ceramidase